jgi:5-oxoprolinase (ATP-hydrolysing)
MGLAERRCLKEAAIELPFSTDSLPKVQSQLEQLATQAKQEFVSSDRVELIQNLQLRYLGTDSHLSVGFNDLKSMKAEFQTLYKQRYGFVMADRDLVIESISVEVIAHAAAVPEPKITAQRQGSIPMIGNVKVYTHDAWHEAPVYQRQDLQPGDQITGVALIVESTGTNVIEPGWIAELTELNHLVLTRAAKTVNQSIQQTNNTNPDPVLLEIFNNLFSAIAEEMGVTLQNTSYSVNIKERLDFSCALFDQQGQLVANAPHIPVHLGSMGESVLSLIRDKGDRIRPGDVYMANNPYNGGTHLPDITVITPVFIQAAKQPLFYVASRGHHADIGGITPGSMPPHSQTIEQEGILFDNFPLVKQGVFCQSELLEALTQADYPARNPDQNIADLQAQIAANERGVSELQRAIAQFGLTTVQAYMQHVQDNAELAVKQVIQTLKDGAFINQADDGSQIQVKITIDQPHDRATIDFTGTSPQRMNNFNAPLAVCKAAVLYVFRTLVRDEIPLNAGCLKPLDIIVPEGSMLNPQPPAAVVAGNVETSQMVVDALYAALGVMAAAQGTMNNFTFGNDLYQYYETICGGSGAGINFPGTDAVQTHMTNSRLTDPEILEWRFPVLLEDFRIRSHSGGIGQYHGGNGVIRRIQFREPMTAAILAGRRQTPPFGIQGGQPALAGENWVERADGTIEDLPGQASVAMQSGDIFVIATPGGGGYGEQDILTEIP